MSQGAPTAAIATTTGLKAADSEKALANLAAVGTLELKSIKLLRRIECLFGPLLRRVLHPSEVFPSSRGSLEHLPGNYDVELKYVCCFLHFPKEKLHFSAETPTRPFLQLLTRAQTGAEPSEALGMARGVWHIPV